jgi:hypothetical protein
MAEPFHGDRLRGAGRDLLRLEHVERVRWFGARVDAGGAWAIGAQVAPGGEGAQAVAPVDCQAVALAAQR